jgi:hypothetical protein
MTSEEFMRHFADLDLPGLTSLRATERLMDNFPLAPEFYTDLAQQLYDGHTMNGQTRFRFGQILREFLYSDDRTLMALLWIADQALRRPELYGPDGCNALAGIRCYLDWADLTSEIRQSLAFRFASYFDCSDLSHNARSCHRIVTSP